MNNNFYGRIPDPLKGLPQQYWRTGDLDEFMERASKWIMAFCRRHLNKETDTLSDFYLYFYEHAAVCLERYRNYEHQPFTGYLATYLRHEFYNFKRSRKKLVIQESKVPELYGREHLLHSTVEVYTALTVPRLIDYVRNIPLNYRLPLKLYYGLALSPEELTYIRMLRGPTRTAEFLLEYNSRRDKYKIELQDMQNRAAQLYYKIHTADSVPNSRQRLSSWSRWKKRIHETLQKSKALYSLSELAELLGVSKSTMSRRINRAMSLIQHSNLRMDG